MERKLWWWMEQDAHHLSRALCGAFCSILHHNFRSMSHPPNSFLGCEFIFLVFTHQHTKRDRDLLKKSGEKLFWSLKYLVASSTYYKKQHCKFTPPRNVKVRSCLRHRFWVMS